MAGFLQSVGGILGNIGKAALTPVCIPMALAGTVLIRGCIKPLVDLAAAGSAYWIKNNFTGESTLFGASTALTAFSNALGSWSNKWNSACFAGPKYLGSSLAETLEETLNGSGWASTGTFDNNPDRDDTEDRAVKAGKETFKEHTKKLKEIKARLADKTANYFDESKIKTEIWLEEGRAIQKDSSLSSTEKTARIKAWFRAGEDSGLRSILHIIEVSDTAKKAKDFFETSEKKIAQLESEIADKEAKIASGDLSVQSSAVDTLKERLSALQQRAEEISPKALDTMLSKTNKALNDAMLRSPTPSSSIKVTTASPVRKSKTTGMALGGSTNSTDC